MRIVSLPIRGQKVREKRKDRKFPGPFDGYFLLRRWWRVLRRSLRCFFFDIRLRRFLTTEPTRTSLTNWTRIGADSRAHTLPTILLPAPAVFHGCNSPHRCDARRSPRANPRDGIVRSWNRTRRR